jgi:hypothetical protein
MTTAIFDTHAYIKKLKAAGVPDQQAEAYTEGLVEIFEKQVSTKDDISMLELRLIKWMVGIAVAQFVAFISFIKYIH